MLHEHVFVMHSSADSFQRTIKMLIQYIILELRNRRRFVKYLYDLHCVTLLREILKNAVMFSFIELFMKILYIFSLL